MDCKFPIMLVLLKLLLVVGPRTVELKMKMVITLRSTKHARGVDGKSSYSPYYEDHEHFNLVVWL